MRSLFRALKVFITQVFVFNMQEQRLIEFGGEETSEDSSKDRRNQERPNVNIKKLNISRSPGSHHLQCESNCRIDACTSSHSISKIDYFLTRNKATGTERYICQDFTAYDVNLLVRVSTHITKIPDPKN